MKISVLGCNGFLSDAIGRYAVSRGWNLHMFGLEAPKSHQFSSFHKVDLLAASFNCHDLLDSDLIVYAIGAGIQSNLKESSRLIYSLNVTAPTTICCELQDMGYRGSFVTFGSFFEMGESIGSAPYLEEDVVSSVAIAPGDYCISKRMLTRFAASYKTSFNYWHFILPTIYGKGENPNRLIPYTVNSIKLGLELRFTSGDQIRQYVHVDEIPRLLELAQTKHLKSGIYNIPGVEICSVRDIVKIICEHFRKEVKNNWFGDAIRTDTGMKYLALDGCKIRNAIGFIPQTRINDVLNSY